MPRIEGKESCAESEIPCSGSLLQAVDGFLEVTNMIRQEWMIEPRQLCYVYLFSESTMLNLEYPTSKPIGNGWRYSKILYVVMQCFKCPIWDFDSQHALSRVARTNQIRELIILSDVKHMWPLGKPRRWNNPLGYHKKGLIFVVSYNLLSSVLELWLQ
jgi:hypothetical protein